MMKKALEGIRVLDMGMFMAGPVTGLLLADMGAQVIKVESARRPDPLRVVGRGLFPEGNPGERPWNRSGMINERNRNKYGITLDLTTPQGQDLFKRLVRISDIVSENFAFGVMAKFGLDYPELAKVNPQIIMISISSQGLTGPEKHYRSFGNTLEHLSGLAYITGYTDELPKFSSNAYPDTLAGVLSPGLLLAALRYRRRTGHGLHLDLSQREQATAVMGDVLMDYFLNGRIPTTMGNRHPSNAPQGCYPCRGEDRWVTITVTSDEEWQRLCRVMGRPELAWEARFADVLSRGKNQDELDNLIKEWTLPRDHYEVMHLLQKEGIASGAVLDVAEVYRDPHLEARGFFEEATHPEAGTHRLKGRPLKLSKTPGSTRMPAPCLGQHNRFVFGEILGLSNVEIEELEGKGILSDTPTEDALNMAMN